MGGGRGVKVRLTAAFFVNANGQKVDEPVIIWKSKKDTLLQKHERS